MIIAAVIFFASVLVFPNMSLSKKPKGLDKHRSYSQWERSRHDQRRYSH